MIFASNKINVYPVRTHADYLEIIFFLFSARWLVPKLINVVGVSYSLSHVQA